MIVQVTTVGEVIDVLYSVVNAGPDAAINFTAVIPATPGLAIISGTPSDGSYNTGTRTWSVASFAVGTETLAVKFQVTDLDELPESVTLEISSESGDSDLDNNQATFRIVNCDTINECIESVVDAAILAAANEFPKELTISPFESDEPVATGNGTKGIVIPQSLSTYRLSQVTAAVHTKGITGSTTFQVRRRRQGVDVDMLTSAFTLADDFTATGGVINASNDDVLSGDIIFIDVDTVHTTPPNGLFVGFNLLPV